MKPTNLKRWLGRLAATGLLMLAAGCGGLLPKPAPQPVFYVLEGVATQVALPVLAARLAAPTLIVDPAHAAAGYDSARIVYVRKPHQLEVYAHSEWVDAPARLLGPLVAAAAERSGAFRAVLRAPAAARADLRLDTELVRLQQEFGTGPSRVRLTLRATLSDSQTRQVLAQREFDRTLPAASEDAYGGVQAANLALQEVLDELARFCAQVASVWVAPRGAVAGALPK